MRKALVLSLLLVCATPTFAADLVNINTADLALLDTLPGIGPAKAQAIIDYRTQNGPFAKIEDIQNVSGIGPVTYAELAPLITVGSTVTETSPPPAATATSTVSTTPVPVVGGRPEYAPIPTLQIVGATNRTVAVGADTVFEVTVFDEKARKRNDARVTWTFGDGMQRVGSEVLHAYSLPGDYVVHVEAFTDDGGETTVEFTATAKSAAVSVLSARTGTTITNISSADLDLSYWTLRSATGAEFKFPFGTKLLAKKSITFMPEVTGLPLGVSVELLYPNGKTVVEAKPQAPSTSSITVKEAKPSLSTNSPTIYAEERVAAPATSTALAAAAGAAVPVASNSPVVGVLTSPWTMGFVGLVALSAAYILFF